MTTVVGDSQTLIVDGKWGTLSDPHVILLADGGWVTTWASNAEAVWGWAVYQQVYNADGSVRIDTAEVSPDIRNGGGSYERVTALSDGGWVTTWTNGSFDLMQQVYHANGTPEGQATQVSTTDVDISAGSDGFQTLMLSDGAWVQTWCTFSYDGTAGIHQQIYNADGSARGEQIFISDRYSVIYPKTVALNDGGWVVTWESAPRTNDDDLYQQVYNADGTPRGLQTSVSTSQYSGDIGQPEIALLPDNGGWVVTWEQMTREGGGWDIYQQIYNADGSTHGSLTKVNTFTETAQNRPQITSLVDGGWVVTWESEDEAYPGYDIYQQVYNADGSHRGDETLVNTYLTSDQNFHTVTALSDGGWVVTWNSERPVDNVYRSSYQQAFNADGSARGAEMEISSDHGAIQRITALSDGSWLVLFSTGDYFADHESYYQRRFQADEGPVAANAIADQIVVEDQQWSFVIPSDTFTDSDGDTLTYSATLASGGKLPSWLHFDAPTRTFTGTPPSDFNGSIALKVMVSDGALQASDSFDLTVTPVNDAPAIASAIADQSAVIDAAWSFVVPSGTFTDVDGDTLSYTATLADGGDLPSWLHFDETTQTFSGGPGNDDIGTISVKVTAMDSSKASVSETFDITVADVNNSPTLAHELPDRSARQDEAFTFQIAGDAFTDEDAGDTLTYSATLANGDLLPSWLNFDPTTRTFTGTPPSDSDHLISLKVTASDGESLVSGSFDLTIDHIPTAIALSGTIVQENVKAGTVVGTLSGTDPDGDHLAFTLIDNPDDIFALKNGKLVVAAGADIDFEAQQSYSISVRATDDGGLHYEETFTISVTDAVDRVTGTKAGNTLKGASGVDIIRGLNGNDALYGRAGDDTLEGGKGADKLYGEAGADAFVFMTADSGKTRASADTIFDFTKVDRIDLTGWDANSKRAGLQDFDFIGKHAFGGHAGELHFIKEKSDTWIEGDTDGNRKADFVIHLDDAVTIKAGYFDGIL